MTGRMPEEGINPVELPQIATHVWEWFLVLSGGRQVGMNGSSPLSSMEILAFFQLEGIAPESWELNAIRRLDRVALEAGQD